MTNVPPVSTGTNTADSPEAEEAALRAAIERNATAPGSTEPPTTSRTVVYKVSVNSSATSVGVFYDPLLSAKNEETASLNQEVQFGYVPPKVSTAG
jgi:hypothetical protein